MTTTDTHSAFVISQSDVGVVAAIKRIPRDDVDETALTNMGVEDSTKLVNELQRVLDVSRSGQAPFSVAWSSGDLGAFRRRAIRLLVKLSRHYDTFPTVLFVNGVVCDQKLDPVSRGGFADIFEGSLGDARVAIKRLRAYMSDAHRNDIQDMLKKEVILWRQLDHPHVLPLLGLDATTFAPLHSIVTPWMQHGNLLDFLQHNKSTAPQINSWLEEAADGLAYLHEQHIVHGDLRAANVLINDAREACLADFGLSRVSSVASTSVNASSHHSNARWLAPELLTEDEVPATPQSDVYALGRVCLEAYTLQIPFSYIPQEATVIVKLLAGHEARRPSSEDSRGTYMPDEIWDIIQQCWAPDPAERPSAAMFVDMLDAIPQTIVPTPTSPEFRSLETLSSPSATSSASLSTPATSASSISSDTADVNPFLRRVGAVKLHRNRAKSKAGASEVISRTVSQPTSPTSFEDIVPSHALSHITTGSDLEEADLSDDEWERIKYKARHLEHMPLPSGLRMNSLKAWWHDFKSGQWSPRTAEESVGGYMDAAVTDSGKGRVFGTSIQDSLKRASVQISTMDESGERRVWCYMPIVVVQCGLYLQERALGVDGLFITKGDTERVRSLEATFESPPTYGRLIEWSREQYTPHDVADVFLQYLDRLTEPVIPYTMHDQFRNALSDALEETEGVANFKRLLNILPQPNQYLLLFILDILATLTYNTSENPTSSSVLAAIFRPCFLSYRGSDPSGYGAQMDEKVIVASEHVVEFLIVHQQYYRLDLPSSSPLPSHDHETDSPSVASP